MALRAAKNSTVSTGVTASPSKAAQEKITDVVSSMVKQAPNRDINYLETLKQLSSDPDVNLHKVTAALLQMERKGHLVEDRREKVDRPEAKDRKVIQYRATEHLKQILGISPSPKAASGLHPVSLTPA